MNVRDFIPGYNKVVLPYHFLKATVAGVKYGFPGKKMTVIGITGTNGKTSTSFFVWKMLNHAGYKTGLMTTVAWGGVPGMENTAGDSGSLKAGADGLHQQTKHMTTVDSMTLNRRMKAIFDAGAEFLVLEVTSHAMCQFRTLGIPIEVAAMTNVTHEHLDYHKTFENYRSAKVKLFKKAKFGISNADDKSSAYFSQAVSEGITYGIEHGQLRARNVKLSATGVSYDINGLKIKRSEKAVGVTDGTDYQVSDFSIETKIPGIFTVYNTLAAVAVGLRLGLTETQIHDGIYALESVEGRMNRVDLGQNFTAIVAKYSDICIITEDDSRDEDPEKIAKMFLVGCERQGMKLDENVFIEINRQKAISMACKMAKKGDIVLVLGKGHEHTILRKDGPHEFEDLKETEKAIKKLLKK